MLNTTIAYFLIEYFKNVINKNVEYSNPQEERAFNLLFFNVLERLKKTIIFLFRQNKFK